MRISLYALVCFLLVGCTEYEYAELRFVDSFRQEDVQTQADILFVVDNSASMAEEQSLLAANFSTFIDVMAGTDADFQVGIVTTDVAADDGTLRACLTPGQPDLVAVALDALDVGTDGSRDERGLEAALQALDPAVNPGFVRDGAKLNVVVFSDEDDHSSGEVAVYLDALLGVADGDPFAFHGVVGDLPDGCASGTSAASAGHRYVEAAELTDGYLDSICADDYTGILTRVGLDVAGLRDTFHLSRIPQPETIEVWVEDVLMPNREQDGWTYSPGENSVVFHGRSIPRAGMQIGINYEELLDWEAAAE